MELSDFLAKEKEIFSKIEQSIREQQSLHTELDGLYYAAWKDGFVWDSGEKKWYKKLNVAGRKVENKEQENGD